MGGNKLPITELDWVSWAIDYFDAYAKQNHRPALTPALPRPATRPTLKPSDGQPVKGGRKPARHISPT